MLVTENQALSIENTFGVLPSTVALEADFIRVEAVGAGRLYVIDILGKEALVLLSEPLDASRLRRYEKMRRLLRWALGRQTIVSCFQLWAMWRSIGESLCSIASNSLQ